SDDARAAAMAPLRAVVDGAAGAPARPAHAALERPLSAGGPAIVSFWLDGRRVIRVEGRGPTAADALFDAAHQLAAGPALPARAALPPGIYGAHPCRFFRFRADSFVERPVDDRALGPPLVLIRGLPPAPPVTRETLHAAALAGAHYLLRHLGPQGRYVYEVD